MGDSDCPDDNANIQAEVALEVQDPGPEPSQGPGPPDTVPTDTLGFKAARVGHEIFGVLGVIIFAVACFIYVMWLKPDYRAPRPLSGDQLSRARGIGSVARSCGYVSCPKATTAKRKNKGSRKSCRKKGFKTNKKQD